MEKLHAVISVESEGRNEGLSNSPTNFIYQLTQPINFTKRSKNKQYFTRIENVRVPVSFYAINSNYNVFTFNDGNTDYGFTLTQGNYTIDELISEIQTQMNATASGNTYTLTYDDITMLVNMASDGTEGGTTTTITASGTGLTNTLYQLIGFETGQTVADAGNSDGSNVAFTNTAGYLKVLVDNVNSNNVYANEISGDKTTHVQKVGITVPITETRNEFQFYKNDNGFKAKMPNIPSVTEVRVKLLDRFNNVVDLHDVPWGFDIVIYEVNVNPWMNK
jgi:hypothetical protein